jgi:hypothetical protein
MSRWAPLEPNEVALQKLLAKVYKCAILDKASTAKFSLPDLIHNFEFHVYWWSLTPILTINILPKTKVKQHHKCHYMFIIHLVPLVLEKIICMQEFSQKWTNKVHKRQVDMAGGHGPTWWGQPMPHGVAQQPTWPAISLIHVMCKVATPGVLSTFDPMSIWSEGRGGAPLDPWAHCHPLRGLHRPSYRLTGQSNRPTCHATAFGSHQAPLMERRWDGQSIDAP